MKMPLARLQEDQKQCEICGSAGGLCACTVSTTSLAAHAAALADAASRAASAGELHRALELGREAVSIDGSSSRVWQMVALSALALGHTREALAAFRVAESMDAEGEASKWRQAMENGVVRRALTRYNLALVEAQEGHIAKAMTSAECVAKDLPQFVPAARLLGLLHVHEGQPARAREVWQAALAWCSDDRELLRLIAETADASGDTLPPLREPVSARPLKTRGYVVPSAIAAVLVAVAALYFSGTRSDAAVVVDAVRPPLASRADTAALARALGQILAAESDSAVDALRALEPHTANWPAAAKARASAIGQERGRAHFEAGQKAFNSGQWRAAARDLSWAVTYGAGSDYHAAAMYLLARSHARTSQPSSAKLEAQELLRMYPRSRYADAVMRSMATDGREP
jgi:tetratricopeptide (TPR) repeat protein